MKITVLDKSTLGKDLSLDLFDNLGEVEKFDVTLPDEVSTRIESSDVVIINKVKLNESNLKYAKKLKLICVAATGYDNVDTLYCKANNIAVCNVVGYSSDSVAQVTVSMVLNLINHLNEYTRFVKDGSYTKSGIQNCLVPVYHEIRGKTWGIIGLGGIGRQVAEIAKAFGCNVLAYKRKPVDDYICVSIEKLMKESDIISIHVPLTDETKNLINSNMLSLAKKDVVIVNAARGAVWNEEAITNAIEEEKIGGIGCDVYSIEPMGSEHPFNRICTRENVCLTPHMAWGSYEARVRCVNEIYENIKAYFNGEIRNRVDI